MTESTVDRRPTIVEALSAVMNDVTAVGKDGNSGQGYTFRSADGVLTAVAPALRRHGVVVTPFVESCEYAVVAVGRNRTEMSQCRVVVSYRWHGPAGAQLGKDGPRVPARQLHRCVLTLHTVRNRPSVRAGR